MPDFELRVGQSRYSGWKTLRVTRSIEQLAHSFSVSLTDRWSEGAEIIPIEAGDTCSVLIDGTIVTTGYVDEDILNYDGHSRSLAFSGRSKTGDIVDCAAVHGKGQWRNTGLLQIAKDLCNPFGIMVATRVNLGEKFGAPDHFQIQPGETVFECLSRGARARGVLMLTKADGNLVFDRAGVSRVTTELKYGENILRGSKKNSWANRFSEYTILAQSSGDDQWSGRSTSLKRSSTDIGMSPAYRPIIIIGDNESNGTELQKRADWERNVRVGRSKRYSYTITGWEHSNGLWEPNTLVRVIDPEARLDDDLLIITVTQSQDTQGPLSTIELTFKEAFDVQPLPRPKKTRGSAY